MFDSLLVLKFSQGLKFASKNANYPEPRGLNQGGINPLTWKTHVHRKSFFDSGDIFLEPKPTVSIYGEIEKRLKMREIDEPSKDLEKLKQILEEVMKPSRTVNQEMVIHLLMTEIKCEEFAGILTSPVKVQRR
ncbi:protein LONGIFOLIA 1 [Forsythia ovata]|uniref:Protein LONGIFOLIA 1 n=1 Tax=Forsythia ovata TaxID=205694 RepID=A0ABD1WMX0_9LAMI